MMEWSHYLGRMSKAAISRMLRTSRRPSAMTGWLHVFAGDRGEPGHFLVALGRGVNEHDVAILGQHNQVIAGEHDLAVSVTAALPLQLASRCIDARQNGLIESVEIAAMQERSAELVLHRAAFPTRCGP